MARKRGHHRLKPEVNPITYIILGVTFIILTLAIILSIDTKAQKLAKQYDLGKHNYKVIKLEKLEKNILKDENTLIVFRIITNEEAENPYAGQQFEYQTQILLQELQKVYKAESPYQENVLKTEVKHIMFVKVTEDENEAFEEFVKEYNIKNIQPVMILYMKDKQVVSQLDYNKAHDDNHPEGASGQEAINLRKNFNEFLDEINTYLTK